MKRSKRLTRIAQISDTAKQAAAQSLARATDEFERHAAQLRELTAYREEYLEQLQSNAAPLAAYQVQKLRIFIQRIDEAVQIVQQKLQSAERRCERERSTWLERHRRANAMHDVAARAGAVEAKLTESLLQRELDDRGGIADKR